MESKDTFTNKIWRPATSSSSLVVTIPVWFKKLYDLKEGNEISLKLVKRKKEEKKDGVGISKLF